MTKSRYHLHLMALLLLAVAASRLIQFSRLTPDVDEVWSIWQTFGTPQQIVSWAPSDWPPLYFLVLGGWKELAGITPFALRFLSLLMFLPSVAAQFRAAGKMFGREAAVPIAVAFAGLGYTLFLSTLIRGYAMVLALTPFAVWFTINYFERPTWKRAVWLGTVMALMVNTHLTSVMVFGLLVLYTLFIYRREIWRWWLPGLIAAIFALPQIITKLQTVVGRVGALSGTEMVSPWTALANIFTGYAGYANALVVLWSVLFIIASLALLSSWRTRTAQTAVIALWMISLFLFYLTHPILGFFNLRYLWWGILGFTVWVGWGVSRLPRQLMLAGVAVMIVAMFIPFNQEYSLPAPPPFTENFAWLTREIHGGDVMIVDPKMRRGEREEWDYFTRVYFPHGLTFVTNPTGYRRVWYASTDGNQDPTTQKMVTVGRMAGNFVGPWDFLWRLYEAPPDTTGLLFSNQMRFHGMDVLNAADESNPAFREGETIKLRIWWAVDTPPQLNYSIGVYLMDAKGEMRLAQVDGQPNLKTGEIATSQMAVGQLYLDEREITIPNPTTVGPYALYLTIYDSATNARVDVKGSTDQKLLLAKPIYVKSW